MLIAVAGSSGLDPVVGVPSASAGALLAAVRAAGAGHVLLLAPRHLASDARRQAHVVVAADPSVRVAVLAFDHHALTLTLAAALVLQRGGAPGGWVDPGVAVQLVTQVAARSRSIVWFPRAGAAGTGGDQAQEATPSLGQRLTSLVRRPGYVAEVGVPAGLVDARSGLMLGPQERLWSAGAPPDLLRGQLGNAACTSVGVTADGPRPYAGKGAVELTALVQPARRTLFLVPCSCCGAGTGVEGCLYCGTGPLPAVAVRPPSVPVTSGQDQSRTSADVPPAGRPAPDLQPLTPDAPVNSPEGVPA